MLGERLVDDDKMNFAPRVGWAWTPSDEMVGPRRRGRVLHAGHGQSAVRHGAQRGRPPAGHRQLAVAGAHLGAPFGGSGTNVCGVQPPLVCMPNHYVLGNMYDRKTPYMVQYVFNVQRELEQKHGVRDWLSRAREQAARADVRSQRGGPRDRRHNPATGGRIRSSPRIQEIGNVAEAKYNSLAMKLTRRLDKGLSVLGRLHAVEVEGQRQRHPRAQRRRAVPAEQQMLRVRVGPVDLRRAAPVRDVDALRAAVRRRASRWPRRRRRARFLAAGRSARSSASRAASRGTGSRVRTSQHGQRPPPEPRARPGSRTTGRRQSQQWFNTDAFALQPLGTYGNAGRNIVIGPGIFNFDTSIIRNFRFGGSKSLQFRLEAFNVFNKPVWGDPNMSMANLATFGTITTTRKPMRELQLGVKFVVLRHGRVSTRRHGGTEELPKEVPPCPFFMKLYNELASWWPIDVTCRRICRGGGVSIARPCATPRDIRLRPFSSSAAAAATTHRT